VWCRDQERVASGRGSAPPWLRLSLRFGRPPFAGVVATTPGECAPAGRASRSVVRCLTGLGDSS
jgi:hypothetical protein